VPWCSCGGWEEALSAYSRNLLWGQQIAGMDAGLTSPCGV
jgi:hypothetical protein